VVEAQAPAKGVWIDAGAARLADNFFDLLPGEPRRIAFEGTPGALRVQCLNTLQDPPGAAR
jgi:hypothetical protein